MRHSLKIFLNRSCCVENLVAQQDFLHQLNVVAETKCENATGILIYSGQEKQENSIYLQARNRDL